MCTASVGIHGAFEGAERREFCCTRSLNLASAVAYNARFDLARAICLPQPLLYRWPRQSQPQSSYADWGCQQNPEARRVHVAPPRTVTGTAEQAPSASFSTLLSQLLFHWLKSSRRLLFLLNQALCISYCLLASVLQVNLRNHIDIARIIPMAS